MRKVGLVVLAIAMLVMVPWVITPGAAKEQRYDAIVVGAGISGLAATWEMAHSGLKVAVIEMSPLYGGTAMVSEGCICIIGTPEQSRAAIPDSADSAFEDFMTYGCDEGGSCPQPDWVHYYVNESRREIYDWLTGLGVRFDAEVVLMPGNRLPRWHRVVGKGPGLINPIYRQCIGSGHVSFFLRTKAVSLLRDSRRIRGVRAQRLHDGEEIDYLAPAVILATGGFQSNLEMVRSHWPGNLPLPERLLIGSGINATGSGHEMVRASNGQLKNMGYQWNYATGLPNPQDPSEQRGLNAFSQQSIWVNKAGKRFVKESQDTKETFPALLRQPGSTYWSLFDSAARETFFVSGWRRQTIQKVLFHDAAAIAFVKSASTIGELARAAGLPPDVLEETVRRWNGMVDAGHDAEFGRIGCCPTPWAKPPRIERPPFYAVQFFPLTRKSMGGVAVDLSCRVIDIAGEPIPGLYAVGELTGLVGVNGKASLEGTFIGASIVTGRVAGRAVVKALALPKGK